MMAPLPGFHHTHESRKSFRTESVIDQIDFETFLFKLPHVLSSDHVRWRFGVEIWLGLESVDGQESSHADCKFTKVARC